MSWFKSEDKVVKESGLTGAQKKGQKEVVNKLISQLGESDEARRSLLSGEITRGIDRGFIDERILAPSMQAFEQALGQTRAGAAGKGAFFSSAARGKEMQLAKDLQTNVAQQIANAEMARQQFNIGTEESAKMRMLQALQFSPEQMALQFSLGKTQDTAVIPEQQNIVDQLLGGLFR